MSDSIHSVIEKAFDGFCNTFKKKPIDLKREIKLFHDELNESTTNLRQCITQLPDSRAACLHAVHDIKSILALFSFDFAVFEASRLMELLRNQHTIVSKEDFNTILFYMDNILGYFRNKLIT